MGQEPMLHMIVGRWSSPSDSRNRESNDSHEIKKLILKEVRKLCRDEGKRDYTKEIGDNPDIGIEKGLIILKGRGKFKNKPYYRTIIPADNYFGLQFISTNTQGQFDIMLVSFDSIDKDSELQVQFDDVFIIPNDELIIELTFDKLFVDYHTTGRVRKSIILIKK